MAKFTSQRFASDRAGDRSTDGSDNLPAAWRVLPVLILLSALSLLDRQVIALLVAPLKRDLGVSDFQVGLLQGLVFAVFYCVAGLPLGWMTDRFPRRPIIWAGVTLWSFAGGACGLANSFPALAAARMCVGVGEAALTPAANSILADLFRPARLAVALSVLSLGASLGNGLALIVGGLLATFAEGGGFSHTPVLHHLHSWQIVLLLTGLPGLVFAPLIFTVPEPIRRATSSASDDAKVRHTVAFISNNRRFFMAHFLGFGLLATVGWAFVSWTPTYMVRAYGWTIAQVSVPLALIVFGSAMAGTIATGAFIDRRFGLGQTDSHMKVYAVISLGVSILGAVAFHSPGPWLFLLVIAPIAAVMTVAPAATAALQIVCPNEMRGQVNAVFLLVMNGIGLALGPALAGGLTDFVFKDENRLGDSMSLMFLALLPIASATLWWGGRHMRACVARAQT